MFLAILKIVLFEILIHVYLVFRVHILSLNCMPESCRCVSSFNITLLEIAFLFVFRKPDIVVGSQFVWSSAKPAPIE